VAFFVHLSQFGDRGEIRSADLRYVKIAALVFGLQRGRRNAIVKVDAGRFLKSDRNMIGVEIERLEDGAAVHFLSASTFTRTTLYPASLAAGTPPLPAMSPATSHAARSSPQMLQVNPNSG
jgi:hypothetical protein